MTVHPIRPCLVCGKQCDPHDRNTDGTFAHAHCLRGVSVRPRP